MDEVVLLPFKVCDVDGAYGYCRECGAARIRTPSGAVCPNSHGRIIRVFVGLGDFLCSLPEAKRIGKSHRWRLRGRRGEVFQTAVVRDRRSSWRAKRRVFNQQMPEGVTLGRVGHCIIAFRKSERP